MRVMSEIQIMFDRLGINYENMSLLLVGNKAINLKLHLAMTNYLSIKMQIRQRGLQEIWKIYDISENEARLKDVTSSIETLLSKSMKDDEEIISLVFDLMRYNALLEIAFQPKKTFSMIKIYHPTLAYMPYSAIVETYYKDCLDFVGALREISESIKEKLFREQTSIRLGGEVIEMDNLRREFEKINKILALIYQMVNALSEFDQENARRILEVMEGDKPKVEEIKPKPVTIQEGVSEGFREIFADPKLGDIDQGCLTFKSLQAFWEIEEPSLGWLLDHKFVFTISDNAKQEDIHEWKRYREYAIARFVYGGLCRCIELLPNLSEDQLNTAIKDSIVSYNRLMSLFRRVKDVYIQIRLGETWKDFLKIEVSRTSWSNILINYLEEQLDEIVDMEKCNPVGARNLFKEKIVDDILAEPKPARSPVVIELA